jgi:ribosomal protein S3
MSLFGHGRFLSTLFFFLGIFYDLQCSTYGIVGIKVRVAGKISVAGNARKRSLQFNRGKTSSGSINTKVSSDFYLVRTSTGCLGLTV